METVASLGVTKNFHITGYLYVHKAMRKDISNLEAPARRFTDLSDNDVAKLQKWFQFFWDMVEIHHLEEDNSFFHDILGRVPGVKAEMDKLTADHHELHHLVEEIGGAMSGTDKSAAKKILSEKISRFKELLIDHLDREEAVVISAIGQNFTEKEQKQIGNKTLKSLPMKQLSLIVPWVGSGLEPEEVPEAEKTVPLPLRIMNSLFWQKKYAKFTEVFKS